MEAMVYIMCVFLFGIMFLMFLMELTFYFLSFRVSAGGGEGTVWRKCIGVILFV